MTKMVFVSDKQRKAVMAKLTGGRLTLPSIPIFTPAKKKKRPFKRFFLIGKFEKKDANILPVRKLRIDAEEDVPEKKFKAIAKEIASKEKDSKLFAVKIDGKRKATAFLTFKNFTPSTLQAVRIVKQDRRKP